MAGAADLVPQPPNAICDASGFKIPQTDLVRQWDGAYCDRRFVDKRNPQDFVRGVRDDPSLKVARPESPDVFLSSLVRQEDL